MKRALLILIAAAPVFAADPFFFVQASDPQFGMYAANKDFRQETANWEFVIANLNRLKPAFVVVTGDLTNQEGDAAQITEYKRINARLDPSIHLYSAPGNHDVTNDPTNAALEAYRRNHGADYYSFREGPIYGIVLDSSLFKAPGHVQQEAAKQEAWLRVELERARASGAMTVIFQHIPWFLEKADEPDQYFNLPIAKRREMLELFHRYGVHYVFAGHYHRNSFGRDGDLEMVTTGPAGMALGPDGSGFRVAEVSGASIRHVYYGLGNIPNSWPPSAPKP